MTVHIWQPEKHTLEPTAHHPNHCEAYDRSSTSNDNRTMMMMMAMMMMHWKAEMCWCKHLFRTADDLNG